MNRIALAVAVAASLAAGAVNALTITSVDKPDAYTGLDLSNTTTLPTGSSWISTPPPQVRQGNSASVFRSPFDNSGGAAVNTSWQTIKYFAVGPGDNGPSPAVLKFDTTQKALSFLWGSPDSYNTLQFFNGSTSVGSVDTTNGFTGANTAVGAYFVTISDLIFDRVEFGSPTQQAFEFANIQATVVPLPGAAVLLLAGLAGFGFFRRRAAA